MLPLRTKILQKSLTENSTLLKAKDDTILEDKLSELNDQIKQGQSLDDKSAANEIVKLKTRLEFMTSQSKTSEDLARTLELQLTEWKENFEIKDRELSDAMGEVSTLQTQLKKSKSKAEETLKTSNAITVSLKEKDDTIDKLKESLLNLEEELRQFRLHGDKAINTELVKVKSRLEATATQLMVSETHVRDLENQIIELQEKNSIINRRHSFGEGENLKAMKVRLDEMTGLANERLVMLTEKEEEISGLEDDITDLENQLKELRLLGDKAANTELSKLKTKLEAKTSHLKKSEEA
ncbi:hypothetical protein BDR26DRAFT_877540, partial [Obelidium mucronatum]